jgi:hypothetical protein
MGLVCVWDIMKVCRHDEGEAATATNRGRVVLGMVGAGLDMVNLLTGLGHVVRVEMWVRGIYWGPRLFGQLQYTDGIVSEDSFCGGSAVFEGRGYGAVVCVDAVPFFGVLFQRWEEGVVGACEGQYGTRRIDM